MTAAATHPAAPGFGLRDLVLASRPVSWINTGLPFLAAAFEVVRGLDLAVVVGTVYFLGPYNLLLYGVNDLYDYESDIRNPRKQSLEGGLVAPGHGRTLWLAILATNIPFLVVLGLLGGLAAALALAITVAVALAYSAPPLRTKERPFLDSTTSALHFVLPAVCGFLVTGRTLDELPWLTLGGFMAWGFASHAIGAIQDIEYDRAAGIGSIATALGGRATAWVSLLGYAIAVVAVATIEQPWGAIAALTLASYLLLPLMVLFRGDEAQARRAWRSFMQLNIPAGFILSHELLRSWNITKLEPWEIAIAVPLGIAGWTLLNTLLIRVTSRRRAPGVAQGPAAIPLPSLTIVVPCRNEAKRLPATLASLAAQAYEGELRVLVVDDGSTDDSVAVATAGLAAQGDRALVILAPPKPDEWSGKGWAVASGVRAATTELVLALDADTTLEPRGAAALVRELQVTNADLVSGVTRYAMPTFGEKVAMPGYPMLLFGFVPAWLPALTGGRPAGLAFSYGPLELVRRATYLETGGHAAVPDSHREDVDLARTFSAAGRRVRTVHVADLGATRHYASAGEVLGSWPRILPGYTGGSVAVTLTMLLVEAAAWVVPLLLPFLALAVAPDRLAVSLVPLAVLAAARLALTVTQRQPLLTVVLHPATALVTLAAQVAALGALVAGRTPDWRGRSMPDLPAGSAPTPGADT
ncbi:MAG TPA: prenyltransferase [Candidatus Limnocylindrales bacterium]|nr:prenyltransferase [Candidatus Limnocylindrales bacterium]